MRNEYLFMKFMDHQKLLNCCIRIAMKRTDSTPKASLSVGRGCQVATSSRHETSGKFRRRCCGLCLGKQRARERPFYG